MQLSILWQRAARQFTSVGAPQKNFDIKGQSTFAYNGNEFQVEVGSKGFSKVIWMVIRKSITDLKTLKRGALNAKPKLLRISDATFARLFPSLTCKKVPQDTMCTPMVTRTTTNTYYVFIISTFHNKLMKLCTLKLNRKLILEYEFNYILPSWL